MQIRKIFFSIILTFFSLCPAFSQSGIPYISYIETREGYEIENWSVCQGENNAMLFANRKGIMNFDGNNWSSISLKGIPILIKQNPYNNTVYVISDKDYGYLKKNNFGIYEYTPLSDSIQLSESTSRIEFRDSTIIFYDRDHLFIHKITDGSLFAKYSSSKYGAFSGIINSTDALLVNIEQEGLFRVNIDTLIPVGVTDLRNESILFTLPYDEQEVLIGSSSGALHLFDGKSMEDFIVSNAEYLSENILSDGLELNDSSYVFSTLYGGAIIVSKKNGKVFYTLNYETGIPDDEIYAIGQDDFGGLWLTYQSFICRVDLQIPIKDFSNYPGIEGLFTNSIWYNGELYVSTTEGIYYLSEVKNYEDVEIYLKKEVEALTNKEQRKKNRLTPKKEDENKRRFIGKLFSRNKKGDTPEPVKPQYIRKKVSKLKSIDYVYAKAEGISSRCQQLKGTERGLLVGSSSGLYVIRDHSASLLLDTRNIQFINEMDETGSYLICADDGVYSLKHDAKSWSRPEQEFSSEEVVFSAIKNEESIWISSYDFVYKQSENVEDSTSLISYSIKTVYPEELFLAEKQDTIFLFSSSAIRFYNKATDSFLLYDLPGFRPEDFTSLNYFPIKTGNIWLKIENKILEFKGWATSDSSMINIWGLFDNINSYFSDDKHDSWIVDDYSRIFHFNPGTGFGQTGKFKINIETVTNEQEELFNPSALKIDSNEKLLRIAVSAPYFLKNNSTLFNFRIEGRMENWSKWSTNSVLEFYLEPGEYLISIRAKNVLDEISEAVTILFKVKPPFYQRSWFYILLIPIVLGLFYLVFLGREMKLKKDKQILEQKVQQRTEEIVRQKQIIEVQNDDITSSITYASRIQNAILPSKSIFEKVFSEYFIFHNPRDIVSGDFYYINEVKENVIFAAADCTGHGVPGAFMSMLGNSFLNEITKDPKSSLKSGDILAALRDKITGALSQSGENIEARDGMDIALCVYNNKKKTIEYSGAYNSIYLVRDNELIEYKADRMPIGYYPVKKQFETQSIKVQSKDVLYLFSDGFPDQFGGPNSKKFTTKRFKQILLEKSASPFPNQHENLQKVLKEWKTVSEQVDDILVLGIRL